MEYREAFDRVLARAEERGISKAALMRAVDLPGPKIYLWQKNPSKANFDKLIEMANFAGATANEVDELKVAWYQARTEGSPHADGLRVLWAWLATHTSQRAARLLMVDMAEAYAESVRRKGVH